MRLKSGVSREPEERILPKESADFRDVKDDECAPLESLLVFVAWSEAPYNNFFDLRVVRLRFVFDWRRHRIPKGPKWTRTASQGHFW